MDEITTNMLRMTFRALSLFFILQFLIIGLGVENAFSEDSTSFSQSIKDHTTLGVNIRLRNEYWNTFEKRGTDTRPGRVYSTASGGKDSGHISRISGEI